MPRLGARRFSVRPMSPVPEVLVDWVLIIAVLAYASGYMAVVGTRETYSPIGMLAVLAAIGGCLLLSRRNAFLALLLTGGLFFLLIRTFDAHSNGPNSPDGVFVLTALMIYRLAASVRVRVSAPTVVLFVIALQLAPGGGTANPFTIIGTVGPWAIGLVVRSRTRAQHELQARQHELEAEQAQYAQESVRYERTRIARDLHDIIAHNVSLMVVQASAGQFLANTDPVLAAETFDNITEAAHRAQAEIAALVPALTQPPPPDAALNMIDELLRNATATGLAVTYRLTGTADELDAEVAMIAYRVIQEGLTNALKHAAGAPITVTLAQAQSHLEIEVCNGPSISDHPTASLAAVGGGHGIGGLRERVAGIGGTLDAEARPDHGWRLVAHLPHQFLT